jgi:Uma2 family endonuclease
MATIAPLVTVEDLANLPSDLRYELIDGVVIEVPPANARHGHIAVKIAGRLDGHATANHLGLVFVEVGFILRRNPDRMRAPDVAFVRADRIPPGGVPETFWEVAPDLVVEVISPNDTPTEIRTKVREWIEAGVRLVWVVYPGNRTVEVLRSLQLRQILTADDTIDGSDVLPGFSCQVAEFFE